MVRPSLPAALATLALPCAALGPVFDTPLGRMSPTEALGMANEVLSWGKAVFDGAADIREQRGEVESATDLRYVGSRLSTWGLLRTAPPLVLDLLMNYGMNFDYAQLGHSAKLLGGGLDRASALLPGASSPKKAPVAPSQRTRGGSPTAANEVMTSSRQVVRVLLGVFNKDGAIRDHLRLLDRQLGHKGAQADFERAWDNLPYVYKQHMLAWVADKAAKFRDWEARMRRNAGGGRKKKRTKQPKLASEPYFDEL